MARINPTTAITPNKPARWRTSASLGLGHFRHGAVHGFLQALDAGYHRSIVGKEIIDVTQEQIGLHIGWVREVSTRDLNRFSKILFLKFKLSIGLNLMWSTFAWSTQPLLSGWVLSTGYNSSMQTLVIGDIHGCFYELQALLDTAGLGEDDLIISIGDCVDRGPQTPDVLRFFRDRYNARLLMGNHERKHVRASRHEVKLARSQQISKIQFGDTYLEALSFMSTLPLYLDLPEAILVHGFFEPGV